MADTTNDYLIDFSNSITTSDTTTYPSTFTVTPSYDYDTTKVDGTLPSLAELDTTLDDSNNAINSFTDYIGSVDLSSNLSAMSFPYLDSLANFSYDSFIQDNTVTFQPQEPTANTYLDSSIFGSTYSPTTMTTYNPDLSKMLSGQLSLADTLRTQQLTLAQQMASKQLDYLKQKDASMLSLQNSILNQQKTLAQAQLNAQLEQFNKQYQLAYDQFQWQKSYQNTLLSQQQAEYEHQKQVRTNITNQFLG